MSKARQKEYLDTATRRVVADYTQNEPANLMERIHHVNQACPGQSKQNIAYLLKTNEYDVNETVRRISEEGAKALIGEWSKNTSKKNKRKKKKDDTALQKEVPPSAPKPVNSLDARPSSDSNSTKQLSNSSSPKPFTAPSVVPSHLYTASLPADGYSNAYQHNHQVSDGLQPNHNLLSASTSLPSNNIQFLLLQLQTHSSYLSQWQGMFQQRMDTSLQILRYVFEQLQASLSERHQLLQQSIETGKFRAEEIFEQRKKLAQRLTAQAKSAPSEAVAERIKQFLADKQNDQQLCDVYSLNIDHEAMLAALSSLGDIVNSIPQYSHWTSNAEPNTPQQVPHKPPNKPSQPVYQPVYQPPEFQAPPVQNYAPAPPAPPVYTEPEVPEPLPEPTAPTGPEVFPVTSQVYEVTLNDPYSSDAKPVDLTSGARQKSSKQELEAAKERMQGMLNKQKRGMIVSDKGVRTAPTGPVGKRGGERKVDRGGEAKEGGGGKGKLGGRNAGTERRGPPVRSEEWSYQSGQWAGSTDNGHTYSTEYTNSNLEGGQDESWDNQHDFVPSLTLVNNNYDNTPDESDGPYDSIVSVASTEFKSALHDISPDEPGPSQPQLNSFIPTQPRDPQPRDPQDPQPRDPQPQDPHPQVPQPAAPEAPEAQSDTPPEPQASLNVNWDDDTVASTDWGLDHEDC